MKWLVGIVFVILLLLWAAQSFAANCIAVVFHDPAGVKKFPYSLVSWANVADMQARILALPIAAVHVYYDQFGNQGGPTSERFDGTTISELSLQYVPPTAEEPREGLIVGKFDPDVNPNQYQGSSTTYRAALDATENVTVTFPPNRSGPTADLVLVGSEVTAARGITDATAGSIADGMGTGVIRTDVRTNGCP